MNFKPLNKKILVQRIEEEQTTSSGIILPDSAKEESSIAIVKAVANDVEEIKVGDKIVLSQYGGTKLPLNGEEYLVLEAESILGILG